METFYCEKCCVTSEIEPEFSAEQEKKYKDAGRRQEKEKKDRQKLCNQVANEYNGYLLGSKKEHSNEVFNGFAELKYPHEYWLQIPSYTPFLIYYTSSRVVVCGHKNKMEVYYYPESHPSYLARWNWSHTCPLCGHQVTYWKEK